MIFYSVVKRLWADRFYSTVNLIGLMLSFAATCLILAHIQFETAYDRWVPGADNVVSFSILAEVVGAGDTRHYFHTSPAQATDLARQIPDVEHAAYLRNGDEVFVKTGVRQQLSVRAAKPDFLDIFPVDVIGGDPVEALARPDGAVLSMRAAQQLFDEIPAPGAVIETDDGKSYRVHAIIADLPEQTHLDIDVLLADTVQTENAGRWGWNSRGRLYLKLRKGADREAVRKEIEAITAKRISAPAIGGGDNNGPVDVFLCALRDLHFSDDPFCTAREKPPISRAQLYILAGIGLAIFAIGTINSANLTLARSLRFGWEMGLRRVLGASPKQIIFHTLAQTVTLSFFGLLLGLALAELTAPIFSALLRNGIPLPLYDRPELIAGALAIALTSGLLSGLYPAIVNMRYHPSRVLGGYTEKTHKNRLQTALVVVQFTAAGALLLCAYVVQLQVRYLEGADYGYSADNVVQLSVESGHETDLKRLDGLLQREPDIAAVAPASGGPGLASTRFFSIRAGADAMPVNRIVHHVGADYFTVYDLPLEMQPGSKTLPARWDSGEREAMIIANKTAIKELGFQTAGEALGAVIYAGGGRPDEEGTALEIVAVAPDIHQFSRSKPQPLFYRPASEGEYPRSLVLRLKPGREDSGLETIKRAWAEVAPDAVLEQSFIADSLLQLNEKERKTAKIITLAAGFALAIAALGLFGISDLITKAKTKEVAIRKVLGARTYQILQRLGGQLLRPVLPAILVAWGIGYYVMSDWLEGFVLRRDLTLEPFALTALVTILIGAFSVGIQALKAARTHPARALQRE